MRCWCWYYSGLIPCDDTNFFLRPSLTAWWDHTSSARSSSVHTQLKQPGNKTDAHTHTHTYSSPPSTRTHTYTYKNVTMAQMFRNNCLKLKSVNRQQSQVYKYWNICSLMSELRNLQVELDSIKLFYMKMSSPDWFIVGCVSVLTCQYWHVCKCQE